MPKTSQRRVEFEVKLGNILRADADVVALKFAEAFFGADAAVVTALKIPDSEFVGLKPGDHKLFPTRGKLSAKAALFVRVVPLYQFDYAEIRKFAALTLKIIKANMPEAGQIAMTIHGVGYGLDESEAFGSQLAGYLDAFDSGEYPVGLRKIIIVERDKERVERLRAVLGKAIPASVVSLPEQAEPKSPNVVARSALTSQVGQESAAKAHVFVAMPFAKRMDNIFHYGIEAPIKKAGFLCERADADVFTGDILERVKSKIETAYLVVADLTAVNPNVLLEVGYAWGKGRPTILLTQNFKKLPFDVRGQRCLSYRGGNIQALEKALKNEIKSLRAKSEEKQIE